ncbi:MAG: hypothetical protein ACREL5_03405 [Gemmatimonadales bacterium]
MEAGMYRSLLTLQAWLLFLGGLIGMAFGLIRFFGGGSPAEYGVMGIGGGFYLLGSAIVIHIRQRSPG